MSDPWSFGWSQLLTIIGFGITIVIAVSGFRTFGRWKKEKIEEKRIDIAIETLGLVCEAKFIFDSIRSVATLEYEVRDMPPEFGSEEERRARGPFYAILNRISSHREFFESAWKVQVKCTAIFGREVEEAFLLMHKALRMIQVSAQMLLQDPHPAVHTPANVEAWNQFRADVWGIHGTPTKEGDRVGAQLSEFTSKIEGHCRPIIEFEFGKRSA